MSSFISILADIGRPVLPGGGELAPFAPELILIAAIVGVLLTPFFTRRSNAATALVSLAGLILALFSLIWAKDAGLGDRFIPMLINDHYAVLWKLMLYVFVIGVILMWFSTTSSMMHEGDGPEFFTLMIGATMGMSLMASTANLLMLFMAVEMASLPSYVLAGFRKTDRIGSEASLKYVLFGAATSAVMVYGLSMLYGLYGTLSITSYTVGEISYPGLADQILNTSISAGGVPLILGLAGMLVGVGFKISAVPLHFWCPDVFEGAEIDVSVFLSVASKGAGLSLLLRIVMGLAHGAGYAPSPTLTGLAIVIGVIGVLTATVGNTGALAQTNIKRLLAYSSIAHAGYMLCALSLLVKTGDQDVANAAAGAILLYLAIYLFMNLGAFTVAGLIYRVTGSEDINDYGALSRRSPVLAACMTAFMVSLIGLPPFAGFLAKFNVMAILAHGWWWILVVAIGINTIISLAYYVRVLRVMYLTDSDEPAMHVNPLGSVIAIGCAVMLVVMLLAFNPLSRLTTNYGKLHLEKAAPAATTVAQR